MIGRELRRNPVGSKYQLSWAQDLSSECAVGKERDDVNKTGEIKRAVTSAPHTSR